MEALMNFKLRTLFAIIFSTMLLTCGQKVEKMTSSDKMPITSMSKEAIKAYHDAREFTDKLQNSQAAERYRRAVQLDPGFALAWIKLAIVSQGTENFLNALDSAKHHSTRVSLAEQRIIKSFDYAVKGDVVGQRNELNALVQEYPGDEEAHLLKGNLLFGLQEYHQAIESYQTAIDIDPKMPIPYNQLGYCQRALGSYGKAEKAFKQYIALNAQNPNAYDSYAELLLEMGRYPESIEYYQQALAIDPLFITSHIGIACDYGFMGDHDASRSQLSKIRARAQSPTDLSRINYAEAVTYVCEGDIATAIEIIEANLSTSIKRGDIPNMSNDLVGIGNLYLESGASDRALAHFNRSIQLISESDLQTAIVANAQDLHLYNIARVYSSQGDMERAWETAEVFKKEVVASKNPVQIRLAHQLFGIIALADKQFELAIQELELADQMNPYNLFRMGEAHDGLVILIWPKI